MKKMIAIATGMAVLFASCVSLSDREMTATERSDARVLGSVTAEFNSFQFFHIHSKKNIKNKAYLALRKAAQDKYEGNIDIRNITIAGGGSGWTVLINVLPAVVGGSVILVDWFWGMVVGLPIGGGISLLGGNVQKITATGDVVSLGGGGAGTPLPNQLEGAMDKAAGTLIDSIPQNATVAILSVYSDNRETAEYVIDELEYKLVNSRKFQIVDRRRLEQIRREQNFQLSGDVDDNSAIAIGNMLGASIVITRRHQRLRLFPAAGIESAGCKNGTDYYYGTGTVLETWGCGVICHTPLIRYLHPNKTLKGLDKRAKPS